MRKIEKWHRVTSTNSDEFTERFDKAVEKIESQGLEVEIHYSISESEYEFTSSALLIGRTPQ